MKLTMGLISANYNVKDLEPLAKSRTIATIPFGGRYRLIDFPLSNLTNCGITTIGLITPYYYRSIMDHVGAGKPWGLARKIGGLFILPGTVYGNRSEGSRVLIRDLIRNHRILDRSRSDYVLISDSSVVMNIDYKPFIKAHEDSGCPVTLMYKKEPGKATRAYLKTKKNGQVEKIVRGGTLDNLFMGVYIVNRDFLIEFLEWYKAFDNYDFMEVLAENLDKYKVNSYECPCYSAIIDSVIDYKKANRDLLDHEVRVELFEQERNILTKTQDETPTIYKPSASVTKSLVAAGCIIEGTVINSVISRSVHIKKGAVVKDSIIMQKSTIEADATIINAICDKYVHVGRKAHIEGGDLKPIVIEKNTNI